MAPATRATVAGLAAIGLWSSLAALTVLSGRVPPFQLTAMAFTVGTGVGIAYARVTGQSLEALRRIPVGGWALGLYGLLGYHVCYFAALRQAPPLEASLINYLWPLLIVVLAGAVPRALGGRPLRWPHIVGALMGFAGTGLVLVPGDAAAGGNGLAFSGATSGYLLAVGAALIWSTYSVASRFQRAVPSTAVIGFCAGTAVGAAVIGVLTETWVWPASATQWLAIGVMGLGPLGLAFYLWDEGMKHGDLLRIGSASYATPLLSTLVMASCGFGTVTPRIAAAALLVTAGAVVAGRANGPQAIRSDSAP